MKRRRRTHLERLVENDEENIYETCEEDCKFWFRILNREIFDEKLSSIDAFVVGRRRGSYAFYECVIDTSNRSYLESKIFMNTSYKSKRFMVEVLCHEMVHHYQASNGEPLGHGPSFIRWRDKLNQKGLNLKRKYIEK